MKVFELGNILGRIVDTVDNQDIDTTELDSDFYSDNVQSNSELSCNTCLLSTTTKDHFKSDHHLYNLKKKVNGQPTVSLELFEDLQDVSSIESLDQESDPVNENKGSPFVHFKLKDEENDLICYKQLLAKKIPMTSWKDCLRVAMNTVTITIILVSSGHFAGAVFDCKTGQPVVHKSFHRYTTRRKQGGAQSSNDKSKGKAKSAGAGIRRYNEQALREEIKQQLVEWKDYIEKCGLIFVRVPATMKNILFFEASVLNSGDERVRSLPFITKRPTLEELQRCFEEIFMCKIVPRAVQVKEEIKDETVVEKLKTHLVFDGETADNGSDKPEEVVLKIMDGIRRGRKDFVASLMTQKLRNIIVSDKYGSSFLHQAASQSQPELIEYLLEFGCDPTVSNQKKQLPYDHCSTKEARDAFRRFRAKFPQLYDYSKANIPDPLTNEMEEAARLKEQERRKKEREKKKATKQKKPEASTPVDLVVSSGKSAKKGTLYTLSAMEKQTLGMIPEQKQRYEREKRAAAAEARIKAGKNQCANCSKSLAQLTPFEKSNFKFCSMDCLKVFGANFRVKQFFFRSF